MKNSTKKLALLSVTLALSMILSYVESFIPTILPGVKLGLANALTLFLIYSVDIYSALAVSLVRIFLSTLLFGSFPIGLVYSFLGFVLSFLSMLIMKKFTPFGIVGVSTIGAIMHNLGQTLAACLIMQTSELIIYFIPLLLSGTIAGTLVGILSATLTKKLDDKLSFK